MPSALFQRALDSLAEEDRLAFEQWQSWAQAHTGRSATDPTDGAQVVVNVQSESHLVGDEDFGEPSELARFLQSCAAKMSRASDLDGKHQAYLDVCQEFAGRGLGIPREHLPDELLRYVDSETLAENLVERMLGTVARANLSLGTMATDQASARLRAGWDWARLEPTDRLGVKAEVFATFEHSGGAPRHDAMALSQALALPCWQKGRGPEILVELTYLSDRVSDPRFPTVADAEWLHFFRPAPEVPPDAGRLDSCCGWTAPLGGHPAQPELVHDNAPLAVVSQPPSLLKGSR